MIKKKICPCFLTLSSGPPNFHNQEKEEVNCFRKDGFYCTPYMENAMKKKAKEPRGKHKRHSYFDDTASSPAMSCPKVPSNKQPALGHGVEHGNFGFWQSSHPKRPVSRKEKRVNANMNGGFSSYSRNEEDGEKCGCSIRK